MSEQTITNPQQLKISEIIAPAKPAMITTGILTATGALASIVPYIALTQIAVGWMRGQTGRLWIWALVAIISMVAYQILYTAGLGLTHVAEARLRYDLRKDMVSILGRMPLGRVEQTSSGVIRKMVCDDTRSIHTLVAHIAGDATNALVALIAGLVYLMWVDWRMTLILLAIWIVVVVGVGGATMRNWNEMTEDFSRMQANLSAATVEMVEGIKEIKNFQATDTARSRFDSARAEFSRSSFEWTTSSGRAMSFLMSFLKPAVLFATIAPVAVLFVSQGWIEPAYTLPFFMLGLGIPSGLLQLMQLMQHAYEARQAAADTAALLSVQPMPEGSDRTDDGPAPGEVRFDRVTFGYDPHTPVIREVSFTAKAGSITALVGPSGGGKTTLARLIARFYDVDSGTVSVGGVDVRQASFAWLLSRVAIVFQDVALTHDTVANNIALGHPEASREAIITAAMAACIHDRIMRLPGGYDTVIDDEGGVLSGGERQRLTIARAYLQNTPILILDEATAQADPESEREIHQALSTLAAGRTVIIIAHRLATIAEADQILVVDDGRIVESGRHEDLLAGGGVYAALWAKQCPNGQEGK